MTRHISLICTLKEGTKHPPCSGTCDGHGTGQPCNYRCKCMCHRGPRTSALGGSITVVSAIAILVVTRFSPTIYGWQGFVWPAVTAGWALYILALIGRDASR